MIKWICGYSQDYIIGYSQDYSGLYIPRPGKLVALREVGAVAGNAGQRMSQVQFSTGLLATGYGVANTGLSHAAQIIRDYHPSPWGLWLEKSEGLDKLWHSQ